MEVPHCEMRHLQHFFTPVVSSIFSQSYPKGTISKKGGSQKKSGRLNPFQKVFTRFLVRRKNNHYICKNKNIQSKSLIS